MFVSYSLHVSIVGFFLLFVKNGFVVGVRSLNVTARHLNNAGCCYEYTIVSVPRIARHYTLLNAARHLNTHAYIELDGGRVGTRGGREEAMMLGRERASVDEGMVEGGKVDEWNERGWTERGMDGARERGEAGSERRMD